ncbi:hypothetical protein EGW08_017664 [Elysia chlorotica]|uniref:C2H2-type domain-containing protein n=1 Tax=Elysia chlorotica TaxID=188477 RepID=A0A433SZ41_ELYCH|nr:hypothetical protein EGW08_017664 [Elysia chlorotica]
MNSQDPHQCPICHRIFGRKSIMVEHLRIHTDEKPYECDFCTAAFRQNAQLRSHIRNRHTKVERYQCSFCHNRFLSRSITIRHIKFHHKLKMKFCQEANPEWTVEAAVWCDDKFEFNIEDPQYLKVGKKNKATGKKGRKGSLQIENNEDNVKNIGGDIIPSGQNFVVKVSDQGQITSEVTIETTPVGGQSILVDGEEGKTVQNSSNISARTVGTLTYATPGDKQDTEEVTAHPSVLDSEYLGSQLLCGTCKMQFSSVSSLREHLRSVHNTTLAESDVSYVFEDNVNTEQNDTVTGEDNIGKNGKDQATSESQIEATLQDLKPVVLSLESAHQRKIKDETVEDGDVECMNICRMCSQGFYYRDDLDQHMKSHSEEEVEAVGMHRCDTCTLVLKNTQEVAKHIQRCHGVSKIFSCSICDKEFFQESSVYRHMKFFHKWEIKIRGEINIPVIVKPAPKTLHSPAASSSGYTMPKMRADKKKMGRYGKFSNHGSVGAEVDKMIQDVVGSKVEVSYPGIDTSIVKIEVVGHEDNLSDLSDKSLVESLKASTSDKESQSPSFIIVRDAALSGEGDTQKIVEKLMTLLRSKADGGDGDSKKLPKVVKVTTVGFSQDEMNSITETDLTEALTQVDEHFETSSGKNLTNRSTSSEMVNQIPGRKDEHFSGKGYISTLGGKKRVLELGQTNENIESDGKETSLETKSVSPEIILDSATQTDHPGTSGNAVADEELSLVKLLTNSSHSQLSTKVSSSTGNTGNQKNQLIVKSLDNVSDSKSEESVATGDLQQNVSQQSAPLKGLEKLDSLVHDVEQKNKEKLVSKSGEEKIKVLGSVSQKSTISTLAAPSQNKAISMKSPKTPKNTVTCSTTDKSNLVTGSTTDKKKTPGKVISLSSEEKVSEKSTAAAKPVLQEETKPAAHESKLPNEKISKSAPKKGAKGKTAGQKLAQRSERAEPQPERRSSSGRLIKRKTFGDEIEDMSPLRKGKK